MLQLWNCWILLESKFYNSTTYSDWNALRLKLDAGNESNETDQEEKVQREWFQPVWLFPMILGGPQWVPNHPKLAICKRFFFIFFTPEEVPVIDTSEILTDDSSNESFFVCTETGGFWMPLGCVDLTMPQNQCRH
jgi:hypothetical protein